MARVICAMNISLDGYVDHDRFAPDPTLFAHWIQQVGQSFGAVYGRKTYDLMRYWQDDQPGWGPAEHAFAAAWRRQPKWVVSRSLTEVGPNATLLPDIAALRDLRARLPGELDLSGTVLAQAAAEAGLIDEYRLYYHPVVLGHGKPFFAAPRPRLRLTAADRFGDDVIRLTYVPA